MLTIGETYWVATANKTATCIANISEDRALFVTEIYVTPFVSWYHSKPIEQTGAKSINCAYGNYYNTLADAIKGENIK